MNAFISVRKRNLVAAAATAAVLACGVSCEQTSTTAPPTGNSSAPPAEPSAASQAIATPVEGQSGHFAEVSKYLDLGGPFYGYVEVDGDVDRLGEQINELYGALSDTGEVPPVDVREIINELGIGKIAALGASSVKTENGFRNKTFFYIPDGRSGLLNLLGGDGEPLHYASLAPAGADIIVEQEVNLKALRDTAEKIVGKFDNQEIQESFEEMLETRIADLSFTVADFMGNANGRVIAVASIVADVPMPLPPDAPPIPSIDVLLCVENAAWLFDSLEEKFITEGEGPFDYEEEGDFQKMKMQVPPDGSMGIYAPLLVKEKSTNRVFLASRQSYLDECLGTGARVSQDPEFVAAIDGLPVEGNAFSYASPEVYSEIQKITEMSMNQMGGPGMGGPPEAMVSAIQKLSSSFMPRLDGSGIAGVGQNLPNGLLYIQNNAYSHKATIASAAVLPLAMIGGAAVPFYAMQQQQAQANFQMQQQMQMDQALGQPGDPFGGNAAGQPRAVVDQVAGEPQIDERIGGVKLKQTFVALQGFAAENDGNFPDSLADLVPDRLDPSSLRIEDKSTGQSKPMVYLPGRSISSKGDSVLLAAPWPEDGQRFVIRVDGTTAKIPEDEFNLQLLSTP
ncbi:MAG: hypothetical protein KDN22_18655 [Verrucomicrobiae bacterium]|nr:hypothetical protein [Verrucomicrobiae bacterium]